MTDHFTHARLDEQSRALLRDAQGDLWVISFNPNYGPEVVLAERGVPESHMTKSARIVDDAMIARALDGFDCGTGDPNDYKRRMRFALEAALQPVS